MTLVDLNSIRFYQPLTKTNLPRKESFKASTAHGLTALEREILPRTLGSSDGCNKLWGDGLIECRNVADSPSTNHLSPLSEETSSLKETKADLGCKVLSSSLIQSLTISDNSKISCNISVLNHDTSEDNSNFSLFVDLLSDDGEIAKSRQAGFNSEVEGERLQNTIQSDDDETADLELGYSKDTDSRYIGFMYQ